MIRTSLYRQNVRTLIRRAPKDRDRAAYFAGLAEIYGGDAIAVMKGLNDVESAALAAFFARLAARMALESLTVAQ